MNSVVSSPVTRTGNLAGRCASDICHDLTERCDIVIACSGPASFSSSFTTPSAPD